MFMPSNPEESVLWIRRVSLYIITVVGWVLWFTPEARRLSRFVGGFLAWQLSRSYSPTLSGIDALGMVLQEAFLHARGPPIKRVSEALGQRFYSV